MKKMTPIMSKPAVITLSPSQRTCLWQKRHPAKYRAKQRRWRSKNKAKIAEYSRRCTAKKDPVELKVEWRRSWIKTRYGITNEQYEAKLLEQKSVCAICGGINKSGRRLHIDHNHKTGDVRGLLCFGCNGGLGGFRDNQTLLKKAIDYLRLHSKNP